MNAIANAAQRKSTVRARGLVAEPSFLTSTVLKEVGADEDAKFSLRFAVGTELLYGDEVSPADMF